MNQEKRVEEDEPNYDHAMVQQLRHIWLQVYIENVRLRGDHDKAATHANDAVKRCQAIVL